MQELEDVAEEKVSVKKSQRMAHNKLLFNVFISKVRKNMPNIKQTFNNKKLGTAYPPYSMRFNEIAKKMTSNDKSNSSIQLLLNIISGSSVKDYDEDAIATINELVAAITMPASYEQSTIKVRNLLKSKGISKKLIDMVAYPRDLKQEKIARTNEELKENLFNRKIVNASTVNRFLHACRESLRPENKSHDKVAYEMGYLQINSGIRFNEIFTSRFEMKDDKTIIQHDVSKQKRLRENHIGIERPLLFINSEEFANTLNHVRVSLDSKVQGRDKIYLANSTARPLTRIMKRDFDDTTMSSHKLRKLYGAIMYDTLDEMEKKRVNKTAYINRLLGHDSLTSSMYYDIEINYDQPIETNYGTIEH